MTTQEPQGEQPEGIDQVREAYERQKAKTEVAEGKLEKLAFDSLGLDPEKGIGKAFKMVYKGPIEPDELETIKGVLADEFSYAPPPPPSIETEPAARSAEPSISTGENELRQLANDSSPAPIDPQADARAKAEEDGDLLKSIELGLASGGLEF